jgi:iron-sulfur cluster assembly accessory protein
MVTITERAIQQIVGLMEKEGITPETHNLRVGVVGGGCSGLSYQMKFDDNIDSSDTVVDLESIKVIINKLSLLYFLVAPQLRVEDDKKFAHVLRRIFVGNQIFIDLVLN